MQSVYLDTSALVKLLIDERESAALVDYLDEPRRIVSSALCRVETTRACWRAGLSGSDVADLLGAVQVIALDRSILQDAAVLEPPSIRSLDAIHLASARQMDDPELDFVTYDARLADAARAHGLRVVQPGR